MRPKTARPPPDVMLALIMTRSVIAGIASAVIVVAAGALPVAGRSPQVPPPGVGPVPPAAGQAQRDPVAQPSVRRVPVGNSVISGTVTAAIVEIACRRAFEMPEVATAQAAQHPCAADARRSP